MSRTLLCSMLAVVALVLSLLLPARTSAYWVQSGNGVCRASETQRLPKIVRDDVGGAICSWIDLRSSPGYDIYAERVDSLGVRGWNPDYGKEVCTAPDSQWCVDMIPDGAGGQ